MSLDCQQPQREISSLKMRETFQSLVFTVQMTSWWLKCMGETHIDYVSKVLYPEDDGINEVFYQRILNTWKFSETDEDAAFLSQDVVKKLVGDNTKTPSWIKNMMAFKDDMIELNLC